MANEFKKIKEIDQSKFYSQSVNSRKVESIQLNSGEAYLFYVDQCVDGGSLTYDLEKTVKGEKTKIAETKFPDSEGLPVGLRVLTGYYRIYSDAGKTNMSPGGMKWIGYKTAVAEGEPTFPRKILPIMEAYSINVSYDKALNQIHLHFWTNLVITEGVLPTYGWDTIAIQKDVGEFYDTQGMRQTNVQKVLCYARGTFIKGSVDASLLDPEMPSYLDPKNLDPYSKIKFADYIPIFEQPEILHSYTYADSFVSDLSGGSGGGFPYGDQYVFGLGIESINTGTDWKIKMNVWNPIVSTNGILTNPWLQMDQEGSISSDGIIPTKTALSVEIKTEDWIEIESKANPPPTTPTLRIIVYYQIDTYNGTESLKASTDSRIAMNLPSTTAADDLDALRYYKIPIVILEAKQSKAEGDAPEGPFTGPVKSASVYMDMVHGLVNPNRGA